MNDRLNRIRAQIATFLIALASSISPTLREASPTQAPTGTPKPAPTYSRGPGKRRNRPKGYKADWNASITQQARDARFRRDL